MIQVVGDVRANFASMRLIEVSFAKMGPIVANARDVKIRKTCVCIQ